MVLYLLYSHKIEAYIPIPRDGFKDIANGIEEKSNASVTLLAKVQYFLYFQLPKHRSSFHGLSFNNI